MSGENVPDCDKRSLIYINKEQNDVGRHTKPDSGIHFSLYG